MFVMINWRSDARPPSPALAGEGWGEGRGKGATLSLQGAHSALRATFSCESRRREHCVFSPTPERDIAARL
jgi:hypothetical protein